MADQDNTIGESSKEEMKIWIDQDGIANVKLIKNIDMESIDNLIKEGREIVRRFSGDLLVLVDITSGLIPLSSKLRKDIAGRVKELFQELTPKKVAVFGGIIARTIASFIITASGVKSDIKLFSSKEEAVKWLKQG